MSDISNTPTPQPTPQPAPQYTAPVPPRRTFFRSPWFVGLAFVAVALTAFGAGRVSGRFSAWHHMTGYGWERHSGAGAGMMRGFGPERMLDRALSGVNATNDQRMKIEAIARQTFTEMRPLRDQRRAVSTQIATLLQAETVDRAAIERLRAEQLALADNVTKRWSQAIGDAAEVLDASQRKQLVARWENRRGWRG